MLGISQDVSPQASKRHIWSANADLFFVRLGGCSAWLGLARLPRLFEASSSEVRKTGPGRGIPLPRAVIMTGATIFSFTLRHFSNSLTLVYAQNLK